MKYVRLLNVLSIIGATLFASGCVSNAGNNNETTLKVEVEQIKATDASQIFSYSGTIEELKTIPLSFSSLGTVSQVFISKRSVIKKDQLLAALDNATYQNAYTMAHATEQQAEDACNNE